MTRHAGITVSSMASADKMPMAAMSPKSRTAGTPKVASEAKPAAATRARRHHDRPDPHERRHHGGPVVVQLLEAFVVALQDLDGMARSDRKHKDRRDCGPRSDPDAENRDETGAPDHGEDRGHEREYDRLPGAEGLVVHDGDHRERE